MRAAFRRRVVEPVLAILRQGTSPRQLAIALALGAVIGAFPVLGTTTALCAIVAVALRVNLVAIQAANYAAYPLQLVLLIPFVRMGERVSGARPLPLSLSGIVSLFDAGFAHALATLSGSLARAVLAWALVAPVAFALLYPALHAVLRRTTAARAAASRAA